MGARKVEDDAEVVVDTFGSHRFIPAIDIVGKEVNIFAAWADNIPEGTE